jgi:hypothetical protein
MGSEARDTEEPKRYFDSNVWQRAKTPAQGVAHAVATGLGVDEVHAILLDKDGAPSHARYLLDKRIIAAGSGAGSSMSDLFTIVWAFWNPARRPVGRGCGLLFYPILPPLAQ